jgi:hypothetical protein
MIYPGAVYHILNRGDRRETIFRTDPDRVLFLDTLAEGCEKTGWQVPALWLRREATMTLTWIAGRLNMGTAGSLANLLGAARKK